MSQLTKTLTSIIVIGLLFLSGFIVGKRSVKVETITEIKYLPGDTIRDSIDRPVPIYIETPVDTASLIESCIESGNYDYLIPTIVKDSIVYIAADSAKIVKDWMSTRTYSELLFDIDTVGSCTIKANVQYNQLRNLSYSFVPVHKEINSTSIIKPRFEPFVGAGFGTDNWGLVQAGGFFENGIGVGYQYQRGFDNKVNNHSLIVMYKF